jgi:hypothetical protein
MSIDCIAVITDGNYGKMMASAQFYNLLLVPSNDQSSPLAVCFATLCSTQEQEAINSTIRINGATTPLNRLSNEHIKRRVSGWSWGIVHRTYVK